MPTSQFSPAELYEFWQLGDVNLDGKINDKDLDLITDNLGGFLPSVDLNDDQIVNTTDLQIAASNFGLDIYSYFGTFDYDLPKNIILGGLVIFSIGALAYMLVKN